MTWTDELKVIGCQAELRRLADLWATIKESLEPNPSAGDKVSGTKNPPAPIRLDLSQWIYEFELLFVTHFTHELCDAYPELRPPADTPSRIRLLADRAGFFNEAFGDEFQERFNHLERLLAPPEPPKFASTCPTPDCPGALYKRPHFNGAKCPECGAWWDNQTIAGVQAEAFSAERDTIAKTAERLAIVTPGTPSHTLGERLKKQVQRGLLHRDRAGTVSFAEAYELQLRLARKRA